MFDKEVSEKAMALQDTPRWELAIEEADLMFPEAAETFSCALGILDGEWTFPAIEPVK